MPSLPEERRLSLHSLIETPKGTTFGFELDANPARIPALHEVTLRWGFESSRAPAAAHVPDRPRSTQRTSPTIRSTASSFDKPARGTN